MKDGWKTIFLVFGLAALAGVAGDVTPNIFPLPAVGNRRSVSVDEISARSDVIRRGSSKHDLKLTVEVVR